MATNPFDDIPTGDGTATSVAPNPFDSIPTESAPPKDLLGGTPSPFNFASSFTPEGVQLGGVGSLPADAASPRTLTPSDMANVKFTPPQQFSPLEDIAGQPDAGLTTAFASQLPKDIAKGFKIAGNVPLGVGADVANLLVGNGAITANEQTGQLQPWENTLAAVKGKNLPVEQTIETLPASQRIPVGVVSGLTKAAPKIAALALAPASLPAQMLGSGLLFGLNDEGDFSVKEAGLMALLPGVSAAGKIAMGKAITAGLKGTGLTGILLEEPAVQKALMIGGDQVAMNAYMLAMQTPELASLKDSDPQKFWSIIGSTVGQNLAFGALHLRKGEGDGGGGVSPAADRAARQALTPMQVAWEQFGMGKADVERGRLPSTVFPNLLSDAESTWKPTTLESGPARGGFNESINHQIKVPENQPTPPAAPAEPAPVVPVEPVAPKAAEAAPIVEPKSPSVATAPDEVAQKVAKDTGFTLVKKEQVGAMKIPTPEQMASYPEHVQKGLKEFFAKNKPEWEFTDTRKGSPTEGRTFRAPIDATESQILESYRKSVPEPPSVQKPSEPVKPPEPNKPPVVGAAPVEPVKPTLKQSKQTFTDLVREWGEKLGFVSDLQRYSSGVNERMTRGHDSMSLRGKIENGRVVKSVHEAILKAVGQDPGIKTPQAFAEALPKFQKLIEEYKAKVAEEEKQLEADNNLKSGSGAIPEDVSTDFLPPEEPKPLKPGALVGKDWVDATGKDTLSLTGESAVDAAKAAEEKAKKAADKKAAEDNQPPLLRMGDTYVIPDGVSHAEARAELARLESEFPGAMRSNIVKNHHGLPDSLHQTAYRQGGNPIRINAAVSGGEAWFNLANMDSIADFRKAWFHEQAGHFATDKQLGPKLDRFMEQTHDSFADHPVMKQVRANYKNGDGVLWGREFIAKISENPQANPGAWKKIVAQFRSWLRDIGWVKEVSENDIQVLLSKSMDALRAKERQGAGTGEALSLKGEPNPGEKAKSEETTKPGMFSQFAQKDVLPAISKSLTTVKQAAGEIQAGLTPPNVSALSKRTAGNLRENLADLARKTEIASRELKKAANELGKADNATNLEFIRRSEAGLPQTSPALQSISTKLKQGFDQRVEQVRALGTGKLDEVIADYFPHIWTKSSVDALHGVEPRADNVWARIFGKRPLAGSGAFLKQRSFPTTADGVKAGLVPVTYNPVELALLKMREMDKFIAGQKIFQEMKGNETAKFVKFGEAPPVGWTKINDKIARVLQYSEEAKGMVLRGEYYAPEAAARVLNNYLSPGLRGNVFFDVARGTGNVLNQAQLGMSAYHLTFTAIDSATSALSLGLKQIAESRGRPTQIGSGLLNVSKAAIPLYAPLENFIKSSPFLREYYKPGSVGGEIAQIVDGFQAAGGRVKMDSFYKNSSIENFWKALKEGNYPGAIMRAPWAGLHLVSKPVMEVMVPRMKIGIFMDMAKYELSRMSPEQKANRDYVRQKLGDAWNSVDNRMGQMVYDNLFWNKTLKDLAMVSVRSVGWNLGTLRELGGGVSDATIGAAKTIIQGRETGKGKGTTRIPEFTNRMGYVVALPVLVGLYSAMYQYLKTGQGPQELKDYFMPKTGQKNPDGTAERIVLPTYIKDVAPLAVATSHGGVGGGVKRFVGMVQNKANPSISAVLQMLHNKDFYGTQIRNPDDPLVQQAMQEARFVGTQFVPFSIRNIKQRVSSSKATDVEGVFGLVPAGKELMQTKAQAMMSEIIQSRRPEGGTPQEVAARRQALKIINTQSKDTSDAQDKIIELYQSGGLTKEQARNAIGNLNKPADIRSFKSLSVNESIKVFEASSRAEKDIFEPYLKEKIRNAVKSGNWPTGKEFPNFDEEPTTPKSKRGYSAFEP